MFGYRSRHASRRPTNAGEAGQEGATAAGAEMASAASAQAPAIDAERPVVVEAPARAEAPAGSGGSAVEAQASGEASAAQGSAQESSSPRRPRSRGRGRRGGVNRRGGRGRAEEASSSQENGGQSVQERGRGGDRGNARGGAQGGSRGSSPAEGGNASRILFHPTIGKALDFAIRQFHGKPRRLDQQPLMAQSMAVALMLAKVNQPDAVIAAGLLYGVLDETDCDARTLRRSVSTDVAVIVEATAQSRTERAPQSAPQGAPEASSPAEASQEAVEETSPAVSQTGGAEEPRGVPEGEPSPELPESTEPVDAAPRNVAADASTEQRLEQFLGRLKTAPQGALAVLCAGKIHELMSVASSYRVRRQQGVSDASVEQFAQSARGVYRTVRDAWRNCPLLPQFAQELDRLEQLMRGRSGRGSERRWGAEENGGAAQAGEETFRTAGDRGRDRQEQEGARLEQPEPEEIDPGLPREIESKFLVKDPGILEQIMQLQGVAGFSVMSREQLTHQDIYFDTEDLTLAKNHMALKLRQIGELYEATFKREVTRRQGILERVEVTAVISPNQVPQMMADRLMVEPVKLAKRFTKRRPLIEILRAETNRRRMLLERNEQQVELSTDRVVYRRVRLEMVGRMEVEIENKGAPDEAYQEVIDGLLAQFPNQLELSTISKLEHGLRLMGLQLHRT